MYNKLDRSRSAATGQGATELQEKVRFEMRLLAQAMYMGTLRHPYLVLTTKAFFVEVIMVITRACMQGWRFVVEHLVL